ncbi:trypsin alpha-3 [Drosophila mojavensis]|uniref:trypsin n=1 Tax=Drosophila mojavensis TaxID=7230 RepID=B4L1P1_DROMO|nr:trypsin alpha-3 [Drosophila mojavensis]EDW07677.1 uncharacterized protein Dmoj_GI15880 [Drosophila mojavensis]
MGKLGALQLLLLVGFLAMAVANDSAPEGRILGGEEAAANYAPYAVSLRIDNAHVCGASIVSESHLLTAAHCCYRDGKLVDASRLSARVGSTNQYAGGRIVTVDSVTPHPDYNQLSNNLAVIKLASPLTLTDRIQTIELVDIDEALPEDGAKVSVAGWGTTVEGITSFKLRQLDLKLAASSSCLDAYSDYDPAKSFCLAHALREGTCHGDGGSAAIHNGRLIGVSNFVVGACGSRYPDVFVRVAGYKDWLQEQLRN